MKKLIPLLFLSLFSSAFIEAQHLLYAVTYGGGSYGDGVIFYYDPITSKDSTVFKFNGTNGAFPNCDLLYASNGLLYGMTQFGGKYNMGTVFSFNKNTKTETVLVSLNDTNGSGEHGGNNLIQGKEGLLYGTSWAGGSHQAGTLFSYDISTGKDSVRLNFDTLTSGCAPCRELYQDTITGILYGTTELGGKYRQGVLYSFNPATNKDSVLINFDTSGGGPYAPLSGLIRASNGLLYSMAPGGGRHKVGVIYTYNIATDILDTIFSFNIIDGASPWSNDLIQLSNGMMYGMTNSGGSAFNGTVFSFNPITDNEQVLVNFGTLNGSAPFGRLLQDPANGLLYGMTYSGGSLAEGNVFSYDITTSTYTVLFDFNDSDGAYPTSGFTLVDTSKSAGINTIKTDAGVRVYPNPSNGRFNIGVSNKEQGISNMKIEIYNVLGEKVYSNYQITKSSNYQIDLSSQPTGVYFYRVISETGDLVGEGKLVIQK